MIVLSSSRTNDGRTNDGRTNDGRTNDGRTNDSAPCVCVRAGAYSGFFQEDG